MHNADKIDFAKLLGFATVSDQIDEGFDFQDEAIGDKLGARIGPEAEPFVAPGLTESRLPRKRDGCG